MNKLGFQYYASYPTSNFIQSMLIKHLFMTNPRNHFQACEGHGGNQGGSQHGFIKGKSCLTILISFYDEKTGLVGEEKSVLIVYLDFKRLFSTISLYILLRQAVDAWVDRWIENWVQRVTIKSTRFSWMPVTSSISQNSILGPAQLT